LQQVGPQAGGQSPVSALTDQVLIDLNRALLVASESLPPPVNDLIAQIAQLARTTVSIEAKQQIDREYFQKVVAACRARVEGRYPFENAAASIPLSDFGDVFGHGGLYDQFFKEKLEPLVDTSRRPWTWRPDSVEASNIPLSRFEEAADIRQMFFPEGGKTPKLQFSVTLADVNKDATRFILTLDEQRYDVKPGQRARGFAEWPKSKLSVAQTHFEDASGGAYVSKTFNGPWAVFQLIDVGRPAGADTGLLVFKTQYHEGRVTVESSSTVSNPLLVRGWQQFKCGS
jgi:type VI secretion system protein ImpL